MNALRIEKLFAGYGASTVLHGVDLDGRARGNRSPWSGATGRASPRCCSRVFRETNIISGAIWVHDSRIDRMPGYMAAKLGISISPQGRRILPNLTVKENLLLSKATGARAGMESEGGLRSVSGAGAAGEPARAPC